MENLKEALSYAVELKDGQEKIVMGYEGKEWYDAKAHDMRELDPRRYPEPLKLSLAYKPGRIHHEAAG